jgi:hypothetical protein
MQLSNHVKITKVKDHSGSADTAVVSDAVDMSGYEGVLFVTSFGTAAAGNTILASQDTASGGSYEDLAGTSVSSGTSDEDVWVDVYRPSKRYVRCEIARGTASTLESIYAIQYGPRVLPVSNVLSGTIIGEAHVSPAEGTA